MDGAILARTVQPGARLLITAGDRAPQGHLLINPANTSTSARGRNQCTAASHGSRKANDRLSFKSAQNNKVSVSLNLLIKNIQNNFPTSLSQSLNSRLTFGGLSVGALFSFPFLLSHSFSLETSLASKFFPSVG